MSQEESHIIYDLIAKQLAGETDLSENQRIDEWLKETPSNQKVYDDLVRLWETSESSFFQSKVDPAWEKLQSRIQNESRVIQLERPKRRSKVLPIWTVAAALLIAITAAWFIRESLQTRPSDYHNWKGNLVGQTEVVADTLTDGSVIRLQEASQLFISDDFNRKERVVALEGSAHFKVSKNPEKSFIVESGPVRVSVLGTAFTVNAFPDSSFIEVHVSEGRVSVDADEGKLELVAGESVRYDRKTGALIQQEQPSDVFFWSEKSLNFRRTPLDEVIVTLSKNYQSNLVLQNRSLGFCTLTANFTDKELAEILDVLAATLNLEVKKTDETWIINGEGCSPEL